MSNILGVKNFLVLISFVGLGVAQFAPESKSEVSLGYSAASSGWSILVFFVKKSSSGSSSRLRFLF